MKQGVSVYKRLMGYALDYWPAFIFGIVGMLMSSGSDAAFTWFLKPLLNDGFINKNQHFLFWLPYIIVGAFVFRGIASFTANYFITWIGRNVVMRFRQLLFAHFLKLPAAYFDTRNSGELLSVIIFNVQQVASASTKAFIRVIRESFLIVGLIVVMFLNSWRLSLIFILTVPVIALIVSYTSRRMRSLSHGIQDNMSEITHIAQEGLEGYREVKSFGGQNYEQGKFNSVTKHNRQREMKVIVADSIGTSSVQILASFAIAITVYLATSDGRFGISAGAFVSFTASMLAMLKPLKNLTTVNSTIQKGIAGAESIFAVLDEPTEQDTGTTILPRAQGELIYENVSFQYERSHKGVLHNIDLTIKPGETVALVGRSGSGKSTLVNLLPRFYEYQTGCITIDGYTIRDLSLSSLRQQVALVSQHVVLFNDSIAKNIAYGQLETVSREEIIAAAKAAHAYEFIQELPEGLDTLVGDKGVLLSGGQRQRLAIARALLKDAPILILDEATSALDTEAERHIQAALETLMENRTTLVIAHRLSTIEKADKIVVMEKGRIIEMGNHSTLLEQDGHYAKLHALQFHDESLQSEAESEVS